MIRFVVKVETLEQLEVLLSVTRTLDLTPDLGSEPLPLPSKRRAAPSTKKKRAKGKRRSGRMMVKVGKGVEGGPQLLAAHAKLFEEFGNTPFEKREATHFLMKKMKLNHRPTATVGLLLDRGGLVAA